MYQFISILIIWVGEVRERETADVLMRPDQGLHTFKQYALAQR